MTTMERATAHLTNYAKASGMSLRELLDAYMDGTLPGIKMEAIGKIMGRYTGVQVSDVWDTLQD